MNELVFLVVIKFIPPALPVFVTEREYTDMGACVRDRDNLPVDTQALCMQFKGAPIFI